MLQVSDVLITLLQQRLETLRGVGFGFRVAHLDELLLDFEELLVLLGAHPRELKSEIVNFPIFYPNLVT